MWRLARGRYSTGKTLAAGADFRVLLAPLPSLATVPGNMPDAAILTDNNLPAESGAMAHFAPEPVNRCANPPSNEPVMALAAIQSLRQRMARLKLRAAKFQDGS